VALGYRHNLNWKIITGMEFYLSVIGKALKKQILTITDTILVVGGGETDKRVFLEHGFKNVVISNLVYHHQVNDYTPFKWEPQDMEHLTYADNSFDWVFVHAALHHCASPHFALCEMLRVAKNGVGVFESRDSLLIRTAVNMKLVSKYELEALVLTNGEMGGVRNSNVPNFIYRWKESEVKKTVNSFLPQYIHDFHFFYDYMVPTQRMDMSPSFSKRLLVRMVAVVAPVLRFLFPKQGNQFAFLVSKEGKLQPWLKRGGESGYTFQLEYIRDKFNPEKYKRR